MRDRIGPVRFLRFLIRTVVPGFAVCCVLVLAVLPAAFAQQSLTVEQRQLAELGITCFLQDSLGRPVSDLTIEVRSAGPSLELATAPSQADGSFRFAGLPAGPYDITVAGGILMPPKRMQIGRSEMTLVIQLPITLPQVVGRQNDTVSVDQLTVPEHAREALAKAFEAWQRNDLKQSRLFATRALQIHPYYGPALSLLGFLDLQEGHLAEAIGGLQQAVHYNPNSPRTYLALASAYNELRQNADALHALSIMAKLLPENWQLHYEIGRAYLGQSHFNAAIKEFDQAQRLAPQELMIVHVGKAHALLGLHSYPAARSEFETVIRKSPNGPYTAESRAMAIVLDSGLKKDPPTVDATAKGSPAQGIDH